MSGKAIEPNEVIPPKRAVGRPLKILQLVEDRPLPERMVKIREYFEWTMTAAAQMAAYAILCGLELLAARAQVKHGHWEAWVDANCPFTSRSALKYMLAAEEKLKNNPNRNIRSDLLAIAPHLMTDSDRKELIAAVQDAVNGQSWNEMQLELGLRMEAKTRGGAREGAGRPTHDAAFFASKASEAKLYWNNIAKQIHEQTKKGTHRLLDRKTLTPLHAVIRSSVDEIEEHLKSLA